MGDSKRSRRDRSYSRERERERDRDRDRSRRKDHDDYHRRSRNSRKRDRRSRSKERDRERSRRSRRDSPSPPRYRFDSPPKSFIDYNNKVWSEYKNSTNPEDFINRIQQVASTIPSSGTNKIDRELYVGNLPSGLSSEQLMDFLNQTMKTMDLVVGVIFMQPGDPVLSAWISNDGHYAFIEFRSIEETRAGYALNNISLMGQPLKVGRPNTYAGNQPPVVTGLQALGASAVGLNRVTEDMASKILGGKGRLIITGLPHGQTVDEIKHLLEEYGKLRSLEMPRDPITGLTKGYAVFDYEEDSALAEILQQGMIRVSGCQAKVARVGKESLAQAFLPPIPDFDNRAKFSSRILVLKNMVRITDLENDEDYDDIHEDVLEECKKHGRVVSIVIPRPGTHTSGIGKIFVEFSSVEEANRAKTLLEGMKFNEKKVECAFHPEELFFQSNFVGE